MEEDQFEELIRNLSGPYAATCSKMGEASDGQQAVSDALVPLLDACPLLSAEQRRRLFDDVLLPLLHTNKPLLGGIFFDTFHGMLAFLRHPETRHACTQILHDMATTCNPREMWILCTEALGQTHPLDTLVLLIDTLSKVLQRLPDESRPRFLRSGFSLILSLLRPKDAAESEAEDEMEDMENAEVESPAASVKITNALGDTDDDLKRKYRIRPETEVLARAALDLIRPTATRTKAETDANIEFLFSLLAGPVALSPLEHRHRATPHQSYTTIASTTVSYIHTMGWSMESLRGPLLHRIDSSGLGTYAYVTLALPSTEDVPSAAPTVHSWLYLFCQLIPSISKLLVQPAPNASFKGYRLIGLFIERLHGSSEVTESVLSGLGSSLSRWRALCQDLITFMVSNPIEEERQRAYQFMGDVLSQLGQWERYRLLGSLIQDCPYAAVSGLLVARLKNEALRAWPAQGSPVGTQCPPFASPKLIDLFPHFMNVTARPLEQVDLLMHALNFYRFLLLRDRVSPVVGVWRPELVSYVREKWLEPLREAVSDLQKEYTKALDKEQQMEQIKMFTKHGFPELSSEDMQHASAASLITLAPLKDLIDWVFSLLDQHEEQLLPVTSTLPPNLLPSHSSLPRE